MRLSVSWSVGCGMLVLMFQGWAIFFSGHRIDKFKGFLYWFMASECLKLDMHLKLMHSLRIVWWNFNFLFFFNTVWQIILILWAHERVLDHNLRNTGLDWLFQFSVALLLTLLSFPMIVSIAFTAIENLPGRNEHMGCYPYILRSRS